jgi:hypothetical protein
LLRCENSGVKRIPYAIALKAETTHEEDFVIPYVQDLRNVVDVDAIRRPQARRQSAGRRRQTVLEPINSIYNLDFSVMNLVIDPTFSFMTVDHDGQICMDCSSARMNVPGQPGGNWRWRLTDDLLSPAACDWLRNLTVQSSRSAADLPAAAPPAFTVRGVTQ